MDNPYAEFRLDPVAQASEFFIAFRVGDGTPAVRARFAKWLCASPEHIQAYLEVAAGWSELPTEDPEGRIDLAALLATARESGEGNVVPLRSSHTAVTPPSTPNRARPWATAASLALLVTLIGAGILFLVPRGHSYSTGIAEQRTVLLADGSTVTLNALTTVRVRMSKQAREITVIRGQAYFHDMDEPDRPFIVRSSISTVRAIGTEFDVDTDADRTVVTVLEGQVVVAAKSFTSLDTIGRRELLRELTGPAKELKAALVSAGEQITVLAQNMPVPQNIPAPKPVDVGAATAWMQRRLIFDDTPLEAVAQQFNLYSKRRLVIADPSLRSVGVSGVYSPSDPAALIGFLRSQPTLHIVETADQIVVTTYQQR